MQIKFLTLGLIAAAVASTAADTIKIKDTSVNAQNTGRCLLNGVKVKNVLSNVRVNVASKKRSSVLSRRNVENAIIHNTHHHHHVRRNENEPDENEPDENEPDENENEPDEDEEDENEANESSYSKPMRRRKWEKDDKPVDENEQEADEWEEDKDENEVDEWEEDEEEIDEYVEDENDIDEWPEDKHDEVVMQNERRDLTTTLLDDALGEGGLVGSQSTVSKTGSAAGGKKSKDESITGRLTEALI